LGVVDYGGGIGTTNVGLTFFNGKLLTMFEEDKPYVLHITDDGDFHTIDR
jgi:9-cis-epoxycarotenoid dioxygenase